MLSFWLKIFTYLGLLLFFSVQSKASQRKVQLDWQEIPGSKSYQIEVYLIDKAGHSYFLLNDETDDSFWSRSLPYGKYKLRIRSLTHNQKAGPWGKFQEIHLETPEVELIYPSSQEEIFAKSSGKTKVPFHWSGGQEDAKYILVLEYLKNGKIRYFSTDVPRKVVWLPPGSYRFGVKFKTTTDSTKMPSGFRSFKISKKALAKANIKKVSKKKIVWSKVKNATRYWVKVQRKERFEEPWKTIVLEKNYESNKLPFREHYSDNAMFRIKVQAKAPGIASAETAEREFDWMKPEFPYARRLLNRPRSKFGEIGIAFEPSLNVRDVPGIESNDPSQVTSTGEGQMINYLYWGGGIARTFGMKLSYRAHKESYEFEDQEDVSKSEFESIALSYLYPIYRGPVHFVLEVGGSLNREQVPATVDSEVGLVEFDAAAYREVLLGLHAISSLGRWGDLTIGIGATKDVGKMDSIYGSKTGIFGTMELSHGLWDRYLLGTYSYRFNLYEYQLNSDLDSTEPLKVKTHALSLGLTYLF